MNSSVPFAVSSESLPGNREQYLREQWLERSKRKNYAALVRTPDYEVVLPIVRLADGRFAISLPQKLRATCKKVAHQSLASVVGRAREMIIQAEALADRSALVIVDYPGANDRTSRTRNLLAKEPVESVADPRFINPRKMVFGEGAPWGFVPMPVWLLRVPCSATARLIYGWMIFRSDEKDGVFRKSRWSLHIELKTQPSHRVA